MKMKGLVPTEAVVFNSRAVKHKYLITNTQCNSFIGGFKPKEQRRKRLKPTLRWQFNNNMLTLLKTRQ